MIAQSSVQVFESYYPLLLELEGGYSNDPDDLGKATNKGITQSELTFCRNQIIGLPSDVRDLSDSDAKEIYLRNYFYGPKIIDLPPKLSIAVVDDQINSGKGVFHLQCALGVTADGIIGHQTLNEVEYWYSKPTGESRLIFNCFALRSHMYWLYAQRGNQGKFLQGWDNRIVAIAGYLGVDFSPYPG